jgi:CheY-like chemotaxis protein
VAARHPVKTIVVVEDEPDMRIFLFNLLSAHGYRPICTATISEGLATALEACPDLIIIDAMLPAEAGIRLYLSLRTSTRLCHIPVVMLSTLDSQTFRHWPGTRRSPSGRPIPAPEAFLMKPPEAEELLAVVDRLCAAAPA